MVLYTQSYEANKNRLIPSPFRTDTMVSVSSIMVQYRRL